MVAELRRQYQQAATYYTPQRMAQNSDVDEISSRLKPLNLSTAQQASIKNVKGFSQDNPCSMGPDQIKIQANLGRGSASKMTFKQRLWKLFGKKQIPEQEGDDDQIEVVKESDRQTDPEMIGPTEQTKSQDQMRDMKLTVNETFEKMFNNDSTFKMVEKTVKEACLREFEDNFTKGFRLSKTGRFIGKATLILYQDQPNQFSVSGHMDITILTRIYKVYIAYKKVCTHIKDWSTAYLLLKRNFLSFHLIKENNIFRIGVIIDDSATTTSSNPTQLIEKKNLIQRSRDINRVQNQIAPTDLDRSTDTNIDYPQNSDSRSMSSSGRAQLSSTTTYSTNEAPHYSNASVNSSTNTFSSSANS